MARYPSDDKWYVQLGRFVNVLDDLDNKMSPTKLNVWAANLAGFGTTFAGLFAWVAGHWDMLQHVGEIGTLIGPYWGGSHVLHQADKRGNRAIARGRDEGHSTPET